MKPNITEHLAEGQICCDPKWEAAYRRFETSEEEIAKFIGRLRKLEVDQLPCSSHIVELFCGRGNGLRALERIGLSNIAGVDLSQELLLQVESSAPLHLADCRQLPFEDGSFDAAIVQGGLHHLPVLPGDLQKVLSEVARILRTGGRFFVVEPWQTPFLRFVHAVTNQSLVRRLYPRGDALAEMIELESETYFQWLSQPDKILAEFDRHFDVRWKQIGWGKLMLIATVN